MYNPANPLLAETRFLLLLRGAGGLWGKLNDVTGAEAVGGKGGNGGDGGVGDEVEDGTAAETGVLS